MHINPRIKKQIIETSKPDVIILERNLNAKQIKIPVTLARMHEKAFKKWILFTIRSGKYAAIRLIIISDGIKTAITAISPPFQPDKRCPINNAAFTAIKPGMVCVIAIISTMSFSFNNFFLWTKISSIAGIIANPPPMINNEILKNDLKINHNICISLYAS